jgi:adenylate/guanylate cyclase family protein
MSSQAKSGLRLEIGHVLFIDIVGYSTLLLNEQSGLLAELNDVVRGTEHFRSAEADGRLVRLPTGDGMALVFHNSPEEPAGCALEISQALKEHPQLRVRMGIHSGPVNEVADVNERANIAGAGINIAQRVMDCGDAGHILLSRHVAEDLKHLPEWRPYLHDVGECAVKHGETISIVNLYTTELGNPNPPRLKLVETQVRKRRRRNALLIGTASLVALIVAGFFLLPRIYARKIDKSIAVLPFQNLSDEKENAYFADGIQDDILTNLSKIGDLKVISRMSVMSYRGDGLRNAREIGKALGVATLLEGSVRRVANRVRVSSDLTNLPGDLRAVPVPGPSNLNDFVKDPAMVRALAKALFWDMQVGSDGVQSCASCHFRAGADPRSKNQVSPGLKHVPVADLAFSAALVRILN